MAEEGKDKAGERAEEQLAAEAPAAKEGASAEAEGKKAEAKAEDAEGAQAGAGEEKAPEEKVAEEKIAEAPAAVEEKAAEAPVAAEDKAAEEKAAEAGADDGKAEAKPPPPAERKPLPKGSNPAPEVYYGTGRRKTAAARVFIRPGKGQFTVNGRPLREYFGRPVAQMVALQPLEAAKTRDSLDIRATVKGGGNSMQAQAIRHGLARALVARDYEGMQPLMRQSGWLTRDSRAVERKKVGLHKARKAPQYSKR